MPDQYFKIEAETPFGNQVVVIKAGCAENALVIFRVFDKRQIGSYAYNETGVRSKITKQPTKTQKRITSDMQLHNDPFNQIWSKAV